MGLEFHDYHDGSVVLQAAVARPKTSNAPIVLVAHQWAGRSEVEHAIINRLAEAGYVGVALDLFGKDKVGDLHGDNTHLIKPWVEDRSALVQRFLSGLKFARSLLGVNAEEVVALGYCFGGMSVLDVARSRLGGLRGVVSLHGLLHAEPTLADGDIETKVMVYHGWSDPMVPPEQVVSFAGEMTHRQADWQFHAFGHVGHAFTNPSADKKEAGLYYDKAADQRSWQGILSFLSEVFD
ncbi:carboxymethylenebutenolidase [Neokomagataea thailandica NBRC 106555]|uniref:Carboxymethylenebutenolidase n=2 Tax=Neokomagataea TaxID=1223423 RepID=A0A4Y6VAM0_9PROT|nr:MULTISPECIES: dienelactone hydrolase family protein [Neokomagataea]QDH25405.1 carboxymethylenebutenolidase [Neokomagataea tanensis]GBR53550.1 carboxymethylenebutenolidase [Neokomagataea thailandica NBRC 106555]